MKAMREFVGIRRERSGCPDAVECVRNLRRDDRLDRLNERDRFGLSFARD